MFPWGIQVLEEGGALKGCRYEGREHGSLFRVEHLERQNELALAHTALSGIRSHTRRLHTLSPDPRW